MVARLAMVAKEEGSVTAAVAAKWSSVQLYGKGVLNLTLGAWAVGEVRVGKGGSRPDTFPGLEGGWGGYEIHRRSDDHSGGIR